MTTLHGAVQLKQPRVERWARPLFEAFCAGAWLIHWTDDTLYWVVKPKVHVDAARRLHHPTGPALESDVEPLYFWHGVMVPAEAIEQPQTITPARIQAEANAEVRRALIEIRGWDWWLAASGAQPVASDTYGDLYRTELDRARIGVVVVTNSTPEPDGTRKRYALLVPPEHETARGAVASTFGLTEQTYAPVIET